MYHFINISWIPLLIKCSLQQISKKHAIISVIENKHYITDFKSSNGSKLEDVLLKPYMFHEIYDGTDIELGNIVGTYHIVSNFFRYI